MGRACIIEDCDNVVSDRSRLDACATCRASINRWLGRSPAEIYDRRQKLHKYTARIEPLVDENVVRLKSKKKRDEMEDQKGLVRITTKLVRVKRSVASDTATTRKAG